MYKNADLMIMRAITPVHVGCGNDLGLVDLPIQREKHSGYPKIESSGIKGCIRQVCEENARCKEDIYKIHNIFGYDSKSRNVYFSNNGIVNISVEIKERFKDHEQFAGAIGFTDGKILLFPVASAKDVYAYVTCQNVLKRFFEEAEFSNIHFSSDDFILEDEETVLCSSQCRMSIGGNIILGEYTYKITDEAKKKEQVDQLAEELSCCTGMKNLKNKLLIVNDNDFKDFVTMNTEVITRTKINNETGAVADGALFTEEYLPVETVMYASVLYSAAFSEVGPNGDEKKMPVEIVKETYKKMVEKLPIIQIGSGATIGKGIVKINSVNGEELQ